MKKLLLIIGYRALVFQDKKISGETDGGGLHNNVNVLNTIEQYP